MHRVGCSEIWGGIRDHDGDVATGSLIASLHSGACDGGRGGDIYYVSVCSSDLLTRIAVADVAGHGEAVSRISGWLYGALAERMNSLDGRGVLQQLNRLADAYGYRATTTGAVVGIYRGDGGLYYAYAGHPPVLLRGGRTGAWGEVALDDRPGPRNLPLGVEADAEFDQERVPIAPGDRLVLYTDGVTEAPDRRGELFGLGRLRAALEEAGGEDLPGIKAAVLERLRRHTGGRLDHDDVTLMAVEVR